ncbi:MAG: SDR family oxidoreductase [Fuerstiella sp.]
MKTFLDKTVFLTGAASGIGRELALQLAVLGCRLYLVDIDAEGLERVGREIGDRPQPLWTRPCDLANPSEIQETLQDFDDRVGIVDLVLNNAGVAYYGQTDAMTPAQWNWLLAINLLAPIQITTHFLPRLLERPDAHIANMCSIAGLVAGGRFSAYHTSKFGLVGFTESLRAEYGRKGIGVTAICPGPVSTRLYESGISGRPEGKIPVPPAWASTSAERVARLTIRGIRKNRRQVLITPMAHSLARLQRWFPGLLDFATQFSRKKHRRLAMLQQQEEERLARLAKANGESGKKGDGTDCERAA